MQIMFGFLNETYQGFYCTLCNGEYQKFFKMSSRKIKSNKKFCRKIIANSFPALNYMHVHLQKYISLLQKFIFHCDSDGNFDPKEKRIENFKINDYVIDMFHRCKESLGNSEWFD